MILPINPLVAMGVLASTAATDAAYVFFNAAVSGGAEFGPQTGAPSGTLLSAFAVISYTENAIYVLFAADGLVARRIRLGNLAAPRRPQEATKRHNPP